jgi:hypothetical protein
LAPLARPHLVGSAAGGSPSTAAATLSAPLEGVWASHSLCLANNSLRLLDRTSRMNKSGLQHVARREATQGSRGEGKSHGLGGYL